MPSAFDLSELFPAMTLEEDAPVKEEDLSMMLEDATHDYSTDQIQWKNFIGVFDLSMWVDVKDKWQAKKAGVHKRPSRAADVHKQPSGSKRPSGAGVDKRTTSVGVDKRTSGVGVDKRASGAGVDKRTSGLGVDKRTSGAGVDKRGSSKSRRVYDEMYSAFIKYPSGERAWLWTCKTPEKAALYYDREAFRVYGSKAKLNFPHLFMEKKEKPIMTN